MRATPASRIERLVALLGGSESGELHVGGHRVSELAGAVGTPFFVYRGETLLDRVEALRRALGPATRLFFSLKANPSVGVCQLLASAGVGAELASIGELRVAQAAGFAPEGVVFAGPGKTRRELEEAVRWGIGSINVESIGELSRVIEIAGALERRPVVCLRVNPKAELKGAQMRMGGGATQFGIDEERVPEAVRLAATAPDRVDLAGLHVYVGSQITDIEALLVHCEHVLDLAEQMADLGVSVRMVDLGGGFAVPYFEGSREFDLEAFGVGFRQRIVERMRSTPALDEATPMIELGRYLVAEAGLYVTRVLDVKESRGTTFVVTDGGMNHHITATGNFGQVFRKPYPMANLSRIEATCDLDISVVGPCCTPLDRWGQKIPFPRPREGELVGVFYSGAYGYSASSLAFLSHPTPAEVLVYQGVVHILRDGGSEDAVVRDQRGLPLSPSR